MLPAAQLARRELVDQLGLKSSPKSTPQLGGRQLCLPLDRRLAHKQPPLQPSPAIRTPTGAWPAVGSGAVLPKRFGWLRGKTRTQADPALRLDRAEFWGAR